MLCGRSWGALRRFGGAFGTLVGALGECCGALGAFLGHSWGKHRGQIGVPKTSSKKMSISDRFGEGLGRVLGRF